MNRAISVLTTINKKLGLLSLLAMSAGLLHYVVILLLLGIGEKSDIIYAALALPSVLTSIISIVSKDVVLPTICNKSERIQKECVASVLFGGSIAVLTICVVLISSASIWVPVIFFGFSQVEMLPLTIVSQVMCIGIILSFFQSTLTAHLHAKKEFSFVELVQFISGMFVILLTVPLYFVYDLYGVALSLLARPLFACVALSFRSRFWNSGCIDFQYIKEVLSIAKPLIGSSVVYKTGPVIDRSLATLVAPGTVSILGLSMQISAAYLSLMERVFVKPATVEYSELANKQKGGAISCLYRTNVRNWLILSTVALVIAIILILTGLFINHYVDLISGVTVYHATLMISILFLILPGVGGMTVAAGLYALRKTKEVGFYALIGFLISVPIRGVGAMIFGGYGIALGLIFYQSFNFYFLDRVLFNAGKTKKLQ